MARREGILQVNRLASVAVLLRREVGHRWAEGTLQSSIVRDSVDRFGRNTHNFEACLFADLAITTRGHRKMVLDKMLGVQGSPWSTTNARLF